MHKGIYHIIAHSTQSYYNQTPKYNLKCSLDRLVYRIGMAYVCMYCFIYMHVGILCHMYGTVRISINSNQYIINSWKLRILFYRITFCIIYLEIFTQSTHTKTFVLQNVWEYIEFETHTCDCFSIIKDMKLHMEFFYSVSQIWLILIWLRKTYKMCMPRIKGITWEYVS